MSNQYIDGDKHIKVIRNSTQLNWKQYDNNLTVELPVL